MAKRMNINSVDTFEFHSGSDGSGSHDPEIAGSSWLGVCASIYELEISSGSGIVIFWTGQLSDEARKFKYVEFTINIYKNDVYIGRCCVQ